MERHEIYEAIESRRNELNELAEQLGLLNEQTIEKSQELDRYLDAYYADLRGGDGLSFA